MTLTIKNADNVLLEDIQSIIRLSSNSYELETSKSSAYANEVEKIIDQVESGKMKTYEKDEFENEMSVFREELKAKQNNYLHP